MFKQLKGLQHHRTAGAGGTSGLIQPPCSEQGLLQQAAQGCPVRLCCLQGWKCHNLSGQPVPVFDHVYCRKAYCFLHWNRISFCPLPAVLSPGITQKGLAPLFSLPCQVFIYNDKIPLAPPLQAEQSQLSKPSLIWTISSPLIIFRTLWWTQFILNSCFFCTREPSTGPSIPDVTRA